MKEEIVGRAEIKLAEAVRAFKFDFQGKKVLDIGSSTGGFTEFALRNGAKSVVAVEIGTRQMKAPLRFDERVDLYEKTDFFEVKGADDEGELVVAGDGEVERDAGPIDVDIVVADVSFVSLRKILLHARKVVQKKADYLVMLKPQFEAKSYQLNRGAVKNERMRREIIHEFENWLGQNGFLVVAKRDNEVRGKKSKNIERFYLLKKVS